MAVACARRVLPVTMHLALCSLLWFAGPDGSQAHDPCIMAVWTGRTVAGLLVSVHFALCSLVHRPLMSDSPLWTRRTITTSPSRCRGRLHGPNCSFDHGHSQLQYTITDVPVVLVMQVYFSVVAQSSFLMV